MMAGSALAIQSVRFVLSAAAMLSSWIVVLIELFLVAMMGDLAGPGTFLLLVLGAIVPALAGSWCFYRGASSAGGSVTLFAGPVIALLVALGSFLAFNL